MKKRYLLALSFSLIFSGLVYSSCSSGDDDTSSSDNGSGSTSGVVPPNTDSGKNNNSQPDNPSSGNNGSSDNTGNSGGSGNTGGSDSSGDSGNSGSSQESSWTLVFEDNFEGTDKIPDTSKWELAEKGTDTWNRYLSGSYDQAYQQDGYLYLFGMLQDGEYKTGAIESKGLYSFTYGQLKCRARFLRQPQGNHTGIWMMPEPPALKWPQSGEIDIMEHLDDQSKVFETAHFWNDTAQMDDKSDTSTSVDNDEFNVYGIIWDKNSIQYTLNGEVVFTYTNNNPSDTEFSYQYPFTKPFYIILSQSLGGKGTWEGVIDDNELPAVFQIDWIKVWQKSE